MAQDTPDGQDERTTRGNEKGGPIERRSFLQMAGAASLAGASLAASGTADAQAERHGISFDRVVHAVDDLGMDDSGNQSIDGALSSAASDGTLIVFPPGTYRVNQRLTLKNVSNFGIVGESGDRSDVEFVTDSGNAQHWLTVVGGRNHLYENFTMQQTPDEQTSFDNVWKLEDGLHIENVELAGFNPRDDITDAANAMRPHITSRSGVGVIKNFVCTGGGVIDEYPNRRVPIWMGPSHRGELRLVNAHIEESGSHSIYAGRTNGCVRVEGGLFKNNDNTNLRVASGHPDKLSWIRGAEIVIDTDNAQRLRDGEHYQNVRGIKVESGFQGHSGLLIEDCDLIMKSAPASQGLIKIEQNHGAVTVRNTRLRNEVNGAGFVVAEQPEYSNVDSPYRVVLDGVQITGNAANTGSAVRIRGRDGTVVKNSCIERNNGDGVRLIDSDNCAVENTNINVPDRATVFDNSQVSTSGVTQGDSCPLPSFDGAGADVSGDPVDGTTYDDGTDLDHRLDVSSSGSGVVDYEFTVDGDLEAVSLNSEDSVSNLTGSGAVAGGTDSYGFSGSVTSLSTSDVDALTVTVDGQQVDHTQWVDDSGGSDGSDSTDGSDSSDGSDGSGDSTPSRVVSIEGTGDSKASYAFSVTGALQKNPDRGSINDEDIVDGSTATGAVWGGVDSYRFDGEFSAFGLDGDATVYVDGQQVDPATLAGSDDSTDGSDGSDGSGDGSGSGLAHTIEITGGGAGNVVDYSFSVSEALGGTDRLNPEDSVSGTGAEGAVAGGTDAYEFDGALTGFSTSDPAALTVTVDGQQVDLDQWALPNTFVVDGTGDDATTEYAFKVSGEVADDAARGPLESGDTIDGTVVKGSVTDDVDAFRFSGDMTKLKLDGTASIEFEDNDG